MRRRMRSLALLAIAAIGLAGCQAIPTEGPVHIGLSDLSSSEQQRQFNPDLPTVGATPEQIVVGFVRASSSPVDDYAVARQFLAPNYRDGWDPSQGALVFEGGQVFALDGNGVEGEDASMLGTLMLSGSFAVDQHGTLHPLKPGAPTELRFELAQVDGEWRITSAPAGIIIDKPYFTELWTNRQVYFLTADNRLVSEGRWFLDRATQTTQIVRELLAGPSAQNEAALRTAFPAGTTLMSSSVPVTDGIAHIDLSAELLQVNSSTMQLIKNQVATSLQSVSGVTGFELLVDGLKLESGTISTSETPSSDPRAVIGVKNGELGVLQGDEIDVLEALGPRVMQLGPNAISMAQDQHSAAVRSAAGVHWVSETDVVQLDVRSGLLEPSLDLFGYVWTYASSAPGAILVTKPGASQELLTIPWLAGRDPVAVRISGNGTRIAALFADGEWSRVEVGSIVRDADGRPVALPDGATVQMWVAGTPLDLDSLGEQSFALLSRSGTAGRVTFGPEGAVATDQGTMTDAAHLGGSGSRSGVRVLSTDGRIYAPQGIGGWQRQAEDVSLIAKYG